ncbi:MAG: hypothetical protein C4335_06050 [Armatimonadota bacterium]
MRLNDADAGLVARCKGNDLTAFDEIVERYQHKIYRYVKRLVGNETDAEDITQEVFLKALHSLHGFREESTLQTWLFRIATNLCRDTIRRRQREKGWLPLWRSTDGEEEEGAIDLPDTREEPERLLLQEELSKVLHEAIDRLPIAMRQVIVLHDIESLSYEEVAQSLGVPVGTVKSRLFHARARLRDALASYLNEG